jgi:hypothetical protein
MQDSHVVRPSGSHGKIMASFTTLWQMAHCKYSGMVVAVTLSA